ncbi:family 43 glycosylhydrolase [Flavobacterium marginilacus]|uniref:family 43 glycosylhydrolase n=1 Tax=Flavobacterium marginilacus TaxID=3003256 RepID=UPI00248D4380|nr:family 43 glycosylhydrolase [Flavobacterium marginilacus]
MNTNSNIFIKNKKSYKLVFLLTALVILGQANAQSVSKKKLPKSELKNSKAKTTSYLFAYFTGNSGNEEAIRFAVSNDGYNFRALNNNQPVIDSKQISSTGGVRDPHILRGEDGKTFYMVATDMTSDKGWDSNRAMVLLKSDDLINWSSAIINIQKKYPNQENLKRVWAPQTIYDAKKGKYMIYWSMQHGNDIDKIYYAYANADFTDLETEPKQLFFSPTNGACIDGEIILKDNKYHLFFKTEGAGAGIKIAVSDKLTEGYVLNDKYVQQTKYPVEGAGVFKLNNSKDYILMYDLYTKGKYQFTKTSDLENFSVIDNAVTMNFHPRHGTVMPITADELARLESKWGSADDILSSPEAKEIKKINIKLDAATKQVHLPVKWGTNLASFNPDFTKLAGVSVSPKTPQDFTKGPVKYTVAIQGKPSEIWSVTASVANNAALNGLYADPDVMYSEKTSKYYIYPTSDGFDGWSGTYFKTFSSPDLVNWTDEGIILDLEKDVTWAKKNAWAPCITEKKVGNTYKYYFYFTAGQKIGVAAADKPEGPFIDSGKPLVNKFPEGVTDGQQIDPDVFTDPQTGKTYLYWGNNYMACAELNEDMISIKPESVKVITPDKTFREGTTVFFRNGKYYFLWSEDDTRSENYRVRYGISDSPFGKITIPENNLVIAKNKEAGIFATGHNSIIQIPGKDEWYIVYHRFNYPKGMTMGNSAGFNREVCIDKMEFDKNGAILPVTPTHEGIKPVKK